MPVEEPDQETLNQWHNDPDNWKLGIFYFNKKDGRIILPKRIAYFGLTINFGNPYSPLIIIAFLLVIFFLVKG